MNCRPAMQRNCPSPWHRTIVAWILHSPGDGRWSKPLKNSYARAVLALALWLQPTHAETPALPSTSAAPDGYLRRLEAALLLQTLNADLLSHDSATLTLERWCDVHHLASPAHITAERVRTVEQAPTEAQRQQLRVTLADQVRYRRVRLRCGATLLSEADNWYVPARLTPEMNRLLESTDTPFGVVVQPLHFQRRTIASEVLWQFLPSGWEMQPVSTSDAATALCIPALVLQHRALLTLPDGTPFSEVVETYLSNVLAVARLGPAPPC
jgi:chorismate-pyruvate lyase